MSNDQIKPKGEVFLTIEYDNGRKEYRHYENQVLRLGRNAMASALANDVSAAFDLYVNRMVFGTNGTTGGVPREVQDTRTGLFGAVLLNKAVASSVNPDLPSQVTFTSVVTFTEGIGSAINEMALVLANGDYFSMVTFGDISKTSLMQLTWGWKISWV